MRVLMGMVAGILAASRFLDSQAVGRRTYKRRGTIKLWSRKVTCLLFLYLYLPKKFRTVQLSTVEAASPNPKLVLSKVEISATLALLSTDISTKFNIKMG